MTVQHFLTLNDLSADALKALILQAQALKKRQHAGEIYEPLKNKVLGMIFEKSSTRTRVSFEAGMIQLGGSALFLSPRDTQLGRGEPIEDTARVLSGMLDGVMIRTFSHQKLETFAQHARIPVINGLTDDYHPCQLLADMQTFFEHRGDIRGAQVAWIGDGNNMCHSYINAARQFGFTLHIAAPQGYLPQAEIVAHGGDAVRLFTDAESAVKDCHLVVTDVWASMGQEEEQAQREQAFANYQVTSALMALADKEALFMHCLPAHRGEEVAADVLEGAHSVVWDEAENRLHAQKALLELLLTA